MKAVWLCFALVACGHHDEAKPAPACDDTDIEVIHAKKKQYAKEGIVAYRRALEDAHLEPFKLAQTEITIDPKTDHAPALGSTITNDQGTFLVGPTYSTTDELPPEGLDVVSDPDRKLYVIQRVPQIIPDPYRACECVWKPCPKPGVAEIHRVLYGPLPKDVTFAGSKSIAYSEHRLQPNYVDLSKICTCTSGSGS